MTSGVTQTCRRLYLGHMLDATREALAVHACISRAVFDAYSNLRLAKVHRIKIIGEAA